MKYILSVIFFALTLVFTPQVLAEEKIISFDVEITAHKDGSMTVEEEIAYDFGEDNRHGIFRFIPTVSKVGELYRVIEVNYKEVFRDGKKEPFEVDTELKKSEIKIGDPEREISGVHNYIIIYRVENGIGSNYETHDEIYWNVTGNDWEVPIDKATYRVTTDFDVSPLEIICYTGPASSRLQNCRVEGSTSFTTQALDPLQGLTVATKFPVNTFPDSELRTSEPLFDPDFLDLLKIYLPIAGILNLVAGPYLLYWYFSKHHKKSLGSPSVNFDIPRELSPVEAGIIDNTKLERNDVVATVFDLAIRKYIRIEEVKIVKTLLPDETDFKLIRINKSNKPILNRFEVILMERLFRDGDEVLLKDLKKDFYTTFGLLEKEAFNLLTDKKLYTKNPKDQMAVLLVSGIIALVFGNIIFGPVLIYLSRKMNGRTELGDKQDFAVDGLKIFLKAVSRYHKFQTKNLITVEKYIPYAIALGLQNEFMEQLKILDPNYKPSWYSSPNHHSFYRSFVNMNYAMNVNVVTSAPSSSSGFSGGSSGGGGGGGGGGSW